MLINSKQMSGTSLIEVLVSIIVLSFGVLGAAQLQITGIKGVQTSYNLTSATLLATDLMERMQNNVSAALNNDYTLSSAPSSTKDCTTTSCTPGELAAYDFNAWLNSYPNMMKNASGEVTRVSGTNQFTISIRWDEDLSGSTDKNCPPQTEKDLDCYQLDIRL